MILRHPISRSSVWTEYNLYCCLCASDWTSLQFHSLCIRHPNFFASAIFASRMAQAQREEPALVATRRNPPSPKGVTETTRANFPRDLPEQTKASGGDVPPTVPEGKPAVAPLNHHDGAGLNQPRDRDDTTTDKVAKDHLASPDGFARTGPVSPTQKGVASPGTRSVNEKAQAFAEAHQERVRAEAMAYLESETRKLEARAQGLQGKVEKQKLHEEAKALEKKKKEEMRAEHLVAQAQMEADKIINKAKEKAVIIKARAHEEAEREIAEARIHAERAIAEAEEKKKRDIAELKDKVEEMIAVGELPHNHKSKLHKIADTLTCS